MDNLLYGDLVKSTIDHYDVFINPASSGQSPTLYAVDPLIVKYFKNDTAIYIYIYMSECKLKVSNLRSVAPIYEY